MVFPKVEPLLQSSIQPYISSILEALMEPTSRGFSEVREVLFRELVELSKNSLNGGGKEKLGEVGETSSPYHFMITMTIRPEFFLKRHGSSILSLANGETVHAGLPPREDAELL